MVGEKMDEKKKSFFRRLIDEMDKKLEKKSKKILFKRCQETNKKQLWRDIFGGI